MLRTPASSGPWSGAERVDYRARVLAHSALRLGRWCLRPGEYPRPRYGSGAPLPVVLARTTIGRRASSFGPRLEAGRWQNLRLAVANLDGLHCSVDHPFSFWRTVGRLRASAGYTLGAHYEGGCITPAIGGGICALTDALYELALRADCNILERHAHTLWVQRPGAPAGPTGVDATVKWPYIDLRFAPRSRPVQLAASIERDHIALELRSTHRLPVRIEVRVEGADVGGVEKDESSRFVTTDLVRVRHRTDGYSERERLGRDRKRMLTQPQRNCDTCQERSCARRADHAIAP